MATATAATRRHNPGRGRAATRTPREWAVRVLLAGAAIVAGGCGVSFSLAQAVVRGDGLLAYRFWPYDGRVTAQAAAVLSNAGDRRQSDSLAKLALRQDATAVLAASTLGANADGRGAFTQARALFTYAGKLSQRDLGTQMWAIEDAVGRGDVAGALRHYDAALRVKPALSTLLFPVLASASVDTPVRKALVATLAGRPQWAPSFVDHIAETMTDPGATAALFVDLHRAGFPVPEGARARLIITLLDRGLTERAWAYYGAVTSGADRLKSRDPSFTAGLQYPSPFDWTAINDGGIVTSIEDHVFAFAAPPTIGGALLQQTQVLAPGRYRLTGRSSGIDQPMEARPYWTLTCQDGRDLGHIVLPNSNEAGTTFGGVFTVPPGCSVQKLTLIARPSNSVDGVTGQIDRVQLAPLR